MKKHLERFHKDVFTAMTTENEPAKSIQPTIDKFGFGGPKVMNLCVDLAIEGRPFSMFDSVAMKQLVELAYRGVGQKPQSVDNQKIRQALVERAANFRKEIAERISLNKISVSADFASLHGSDFLGKFTRVCNQS